MAALCASRWSAIGCIDSRTKNLSMKERPRANCASRWSAVGRTVATTKKKGLTRAGLLMEVADHPLEEGLERRQKRESGRSEDRRRGTPGDGKRLWTVSKLAEASVAA